MTPLDIKAFISHFFHSGQTPDARAKFGWWLVSNDHQRETEDALETLWKDSPTEVTPETIGDLASLHAIVETREKRQRNMRLWKWAAAAIVLVASVTATFLGTRSYLSSTYKGVEMVKVSVPDGSFRRMTLPDSTEVVIAGGSTIISPSAFSGDTRTVFIVGKAHFKVAKDKERPFIVRTQDMAVRAVGTAFTVDAYAADFTESTTLDEGMTSVSVEGSAKSAYDWRMHPGQCLTYNKVSGDVTLTDAANDNVHSWTEGWLEFNGEPFPAIANTLQHRFGIRIVCENMHRLRGRYFVKFTPTENIDDVLRVLSKLGTTFKYKREGKTVHIYV